MGFVETSERLQSIIVIIIFIIISVLISFVVFNSINQLQNTDENVTEAENSSTKLLYIGDSTTVNGIMYTVFKEPKVHKGDAFDRPDGTFFKIYVKVLNQGKQTQSISTLNFQLMDSEGRTYNAVVYVGSLFSKDLVVYNTQPNLEKELWVTFDIPFDKDEKYYLLIKGNHEFICVFNCD